MPEKRYVIVTDSNSETPLSIAKQYDVPYVPMPYVLEDQEYYYDLGENTDFKSFFNKVREGSIPSTSTYPPSYYVDLLTPFLAEGKDVLFIAFSSQLSAAQSYVHTAKAQLMEVFPERRIEIFDTKSISGGMAVQVHGALKRYHDGATMDEVIAWLETASPRANAWFSVDDLDHLKRGGRISPTVAAIGSLLSIKPVLRINKEGCIVPAEKARGRKKAIRRLAELTIERAQDPESNIMVIMHADCEADAMHLKSLIEEKVKFEHIYVQYVGPVIGSHAGPDTIGACFLGVANE